MFVTLQSADAEPERSFSMYNLILSDRRGSLSIETLRDHFGLQSTMLITSTPQPELNAPDLIASIISKPASIDIGGRQRAAGRRLLDLSCDVIARTIPISVLNQRLAKQEPKIAQSSTPWLSHDLSQNQGFSGTRAPQQVIILIRSSEKDR
ncbi:hypothetical protein RRG08_000974 [Elysia crispata]|uniref:Uncharacterized protein n=1 Tax=Elysia crispata TaxID=231223 RepID=A0AAE1AF38_9GAST|nr:hypothetical protein RRG08_000974 [Elysia crispata]